MTAGVPNQNQGREHADESLLPEAGTDVNVIDVADMGTALGFIHVMSGDEQRHPSAGELEEEIMRLSKITGANASGRRQSPMRTRWAGRSVLSLAAAFRVCHANRRL